MKWIKVYYFELNRVKRENKYEFIEFKLVLKDIILFELIIKEAIKASYRIIS